ncbi:MAG: methyltransferase domain-containing protein [Verrucomicrobiae bacterium]|nr:methyltransferase domain-containing protein [Verrucomicrobiae bacterium]
MKWSSTLDAPLSSESFAITDAHYGRTSAIYECRACGFRQCTELPEVLSYYETLEDPDYEKGSRERILQSRKLLDHLQRHATTGSLLDVGAGSGNLVEAALELRFQAEGIEPSVWLQIQAEKRKLPVKRGILNDLPEDKRFDVITLVDVIEHVADPMHLLREIRMRLVSGGLALIVTPDCGSFMARLLGRKWWHYRIAHIGYFNKSNLRLACEKSGFKITTMKRPGWYFTMDYLWVRLMQYFPRWLRLKPAGWMTKITVPINLRDSLLVIARRP